MERNGDILKFKFSRLLNTLDTEEDRVISLTENTHVLWVCVSLLYR
jgi:hypothetical protein